jgi:hypothetical protein
MSRLASGKSARIPELQPNERAVLKIYLAADGRWRAFLYSLSGGAVFTAEKRREFQILDRNREKAKRKWWKLIGANVDG